MRPAALLLVIAPLLVAASAPIALPGEPLDRQLLNARAEQAGAEAEVKRLDQAAAGARDEASRLEAQQAAAAQGIEAAEARITTADVRLRLIAASMAKHRQQLAQEQQPVASLLAGLVTMARRPPLLALAEEGGADEFVKVRVLLDSTMPVIRARTSALSAQLANGQRLARQAALARAELVRSRRNLLAERTRFAALEETALRAANAAGRQALSAGDVAITAGEDVQRIGGEASQSRAARALAVQLAAMDPAPPRPISAEGPSLRTPLAYQLPASAVVTDGLGAISDSGVRSRGIVMATARGSAVTAPGAGVVRFSGPFRRYDGIMIIDHGGGWMSLLINLASPLKAGATVRLGEPLGRAIGPLGVELSHNGVQVSPALIAGSSGTLSNGRKGG